MIRKRQLSAIQTRSSSYIEWHITPGKTIRCLIYLLCWRGTETTYMMTTTTTMMIMMMDCGAIGGMTDWQGKSKC
jgi:hypothetical protein